MRFKVDTAVIKRIISSYHQQNKEYDVHTTQNHLQREQQNKSSCLPSFVCGDALQLIVRNIMWEWCQRAPCTEILNSWRVPSQSHWNKWIACAQIRCKPEPGWCLVLMPPSHHYCSTLEQHGTRREQRGKIHSAALISTNHCSNLGKVA